MIPVPVLVGSTPEALALASRTSSGDSVATVWWWRPHSRRGYAGRLGAPALVGRMQR